MQMFWVFSFQKKPLKVKFITENVWVTVDECNRLLHVMLGPYIKLDYTKYPFSQRDWAIRQFEPIAEEIIRVFFWGKMDGAERANYYASNAFPITAKKIRAARGELTSIIFSFQM
jgi:hypothetical protein